MLLEMLEDRRLLATIQWDGEGGNNSWSNPLNWEGDELPGPDDDVQIAVDGEITVEITSEVHVGSLTSEENLSIAAGSLQVDRTSQVDGDLSINAGRFAHRGWLDGDCGRSDLQAVGDGQRQRGRRQPCSQLKAV